MSVLVGVVLGYGLMDCASAQTLSDDPAAEVPSITQTPEAIITPWQSPDLHIPKPLRRNETTARTAELLGAALQQPGVSLTRRAELIRDLASTQQHEAAAFIRTALSDQNVQLRLAAAQAAATLGQAELAGDVARLVEDSDPLVRAQAVAAYAILTTGQKSDPSIILRALNDPAYPVQRSALLHASTAEQAQAIAAALPSLPPALRVEGIKALGRIGAAEQTAVLVQQLRGGIDEQVTALRALGQLKAQASLAEVQALLKSNHPAVRRTALQTLGLLLSADDARATCQQMLADPDPSVRQVAAAGSAPVQTSALIDRLVELLSDPYLPVHDSALATLGQTETPAMRDAVIARAVVLLDAPLARRRQDGSHLLGVYRSNAGLEKQLVILTATTPTEAIDGDVSAETAKALGLIGDKRAVDPIFNLVRRGADAVTGKGKDDSLAGAAAAEAIVAAGRFGDQRILPSAHQILRASGETTPYLPRSAAAWALGELGQNDTAADSAATFQLLYGLYNSMFDAPATKFEAVKAIVRLKLNDALPVLPELIQQNRDARIGWVAAWGLWRMTGEPTSYTLPAVSWQPNVAIQDVKP